VCTQSAIILSNFAAAWQDRSDSTYERLINTSERIKMVSGGLFL
jgi:hypothetical protein